VGRKRKSFDTTSLPRGQNKSKRHEKRVSRIVPIRVGPQEKKGRKKKGGSKDDRGWPNGKGGGDEGSTI